MSLVVFIVDLIVYILNLLVDILRYICLNFRLIYLHLSACCICLKLVPMPRAARIVLINTAGHAVIISPMEH